MTVLRDSMDDDPSTLPTVAMACPACGELVEVATAEVVQRGATAGLDPDVSAEPWRALLAAGVVVTEVWGAHTALADRAGLSPHVQRVECPSCSAALWATVGFGEYQPARYIADLSPLVICAD